MDSDNFLVYFHLKRPFIDNAHTNIYAQSHFGRGNNEMFDYRKTRNVFFYFKNLSFENTVVSS